MVSQVASQKGMKIGIRKRFQSIYSSCEIKTVKPEVSISDFSAKIAIFLNFIEKQCQLPFMQSKVSQFTYSQYTKRLRKDFKKNSSPLTSKTSRSHKCKESKLATSFYNALVLEITCISLQVTKTKHFAICQRFKKLRLEYCDAQTYANFDDAA